MPKISPDICETFLLDGHTYIIPVNIVVEIERHQIDADRYRWLRDNGHIAFLRKGDEVDKLVDAEMAKPPVQLEI